ncbi:MAG: HAD-IA family hydrolase [Clostridia bacterium]|nr:HAD-IA family hydrolase [Clostridia bacterium]
MIKHIIWDFDGTLFNTYPEISLVFQNTLKQFGIEEDRAEILKHLHRSLFQTYQVYVDRYNLDFMALRKTFSLNDEQLTPSNILPFEGVENIIKSIEGSNFIFTHRGKSTFHYLDYYDYTKYFSEIITREDGYARKPEPDALLYLISKYSLEKESTIYIGDRIIDVQCAKKAGIKSCYFDSHGISIDEKADYTINSYINFIF